jgi:hypothetical protein
MATADKELLDAVSRAMPADASGNRQPSDRDAARVYWQVGRVLNEHLSGRAAYGKGAIARLAAEFGVSPRTLYRARKMHKCFSAKPPADLSWSHCRLLVTVDDEETRQYLMTRVATAGWSVRQLQQELSLLLPASAPTLRTGTFRIATITDTTGSEVLAFDLGFGIRLPLSLPGEPGKRTRRLIKTLSLGDTVEFTTDKKGRPSLRRVTSDRTHRFYVYRATNLRAVATGVIRAQLDLGFGVVHDCRLLLQPPAERLSRADLVRVLKAELAPLWLRCVRLPGTRGYAADLYREEDFIDGTTQAEHVNTMWANQ